MKLYLVRWLSEAYPWETAPPRRGEDPRLLKAFADREAAEDYCRDLHQGRGTPRAANPFRSFANWRQTLQMIEGYGPEYGTLPSLVQITSFDEPILHDWLLDCGLTPPEPIQMPAKKKRAACTLRDWHAWWLATAPRMDDLQRARVWQVCDRARTFEVIEVEMEA